MTDGWSEILRTPPVPGAEWVVLPENGWGAVIAYYVGPGLVRPHDVPVERRRVREECVAPDGTSRRRTVPMSAADLGEIGEYVNSYLDDVGLPPAPVSWWEVAVPEGMTGAELLKRLEDACRTVATSGLEVAREYAARLAEEVGRLQGRSRVNG